MILNLLKSLTKRYVPRWLVLNLDLLASSLTFLFSFAIIHNLRLDWFTFDELVLPMMIVLTIRLTAFLVTRSYTGIIRYTSTQDAIRIFAAITGSSVAIFAVRQLALYTTGEVIIPLSVMIMDYFILLSILMSVRLGVKLLFREVRNNRHFKKTNVIIYGAGQTGIIAKRSIESKPDSLLKVVAFFDDNKEMEGKSAEGVPIFNFSKRFKWIMRKYEPKELILAVPDISGKHKRVVIEEGLKNNLAIKDVPPVDKWINGEFSFNQIRNVKIEDLLGRDPIKLDNKNVQDFIKGKRVLITGAAGSIGSEIARQCSVYEPESLVLLDQAESALYHLEYSLEGSCYLNVVVADIRDEGRMKHVFSHFEPQIVIHAAAYKHVPLMEHHPYEALSTNVFGTRTLAKVAVEHNVEKFVFVSTDKAVNPTNIMGASKRMAEIFVQSLNVKLSLTQEVHTRFITSRFGNVLGSSGSVISRFKEQIEAGGPVTVTHPQINRFFMTIPEACQLVLEAGAMGSGGEIYVFDMGESVKIVDLASKMIRLSGYEVDHDIEIVYTGLRPGEKLNEELLSVKENSIGTHHPKILVARVMHYNHEEIEELIKSLLKDKDRLTNRLIVSAMKQMIPEYLSNNSVYEVLDKSDLKKEGVKQRLL